MRRPNLLILMLLPLAASCHAQDSNNLLQKVELSNKLYSCLKLEPQKVQRTEAGIELMVKAESRKPLAECLCMSTLMDYSAVDHYQVEGRKLQTELVSGFKNSLDAQDGSLTFLISTDQSYIPKGEIAVSLKCRPHQ